MGMRSIIDLRNFRNFFFKNWNGCQCLSLLWVPIFEHKKWVANFLRNWIWHLTHPYCGVGSSPGRGIPQEGWVSCDDIGLLGMEYDFAPTIMPQKQQGKGYILI
jgi:hypothetical protein